MAISLLFFFSPSQRMNGGGGGASTDFGTIYGHKITQDDYLGAKREFYLFYLFHYGTWPDKAGLTELDLNREIYLRLMFIKKADQLGIHVGDEAAATLANAMLRSLGHGQTVTMDEFTSQILQPQGLTVADFENFARHDVVIQQLVNALGLSGTFVTPQEAAEVYTRENQERSAQIVFFSASNYLANVKITPDALAQFYTNYLAEYRLPDRAQVSYVAFEVADFLAQAKAELEKTNFDEQIDGIYLREGAAAFPDAKTPAEAKEKIREVVIQQTALAKARVQANDFASAVFNIDPARPENLAAVAKQKGLAVKITAPFDIQSGPQEFSAPESFAAAAFGLTADEPFAGPIIGTNAVYVIAMNKQLPSEIQPFADIKDRVTQDFQMQQAVALAREAGTNFFYKLTVSLAAGKSFSDICTADKLQPQTLPPFSLSTRDLPELGEHAELKQLQQAAFTTDIGHSSDFEETGDGGFIVYVRSQLPVDPSELSANLPQFTAQLRRSRENEAFQEWLNVEANRELTNTLFAREAAAARQP
jgi:peptidyl-prolyl cis-trans isomerase D